MDVEFFQWLGEQSPLIIALVVSLALGVLSYRQDQRQQVAWKSLSDYSIEENKHRQMAWQSIIDTQRRIQDDIEHSSEKRIADADQERARVETRLNEAERQIEELTIQLKERKEELQQTRGLAEKLEQVSRDLAQLQEKYNALLNSEKTWRSRAEAAETRAVQAETRATSAEKRAAELLTRIQKVENHQKGDTKPLPGEEEKKQTEDKAV